MSPAGLSGGAPRLVPADDAAYEGLGFLFCITTHAAGLAMCFQGGTFAARRICEMRVIRGWSSLVVAKEASASADFQTYKPLDPGLAPCLFSCISQRLPDRPGIVLYKGLIHKAVVLEELT